MDLFTQYIVAGIVSLPIWIVFGCVLSAALPEWVNAPRRVAWAGGTSGIHRGVPHATAQAGGHTDRYGRVTSNSHAKTSLAVRPTRVIRSHRHPARRVIIRR